MKARNAGQRSLPFSLRQRLQLLLQTGSELLHWPLDALALRLGILALLPVYCWRLGFLQGLGAVCHFLLKDDDQLIERHERDRGTLVRAEDEDRRAFQQVFILEAYRALSQRHAVRVIVDVGAQVGYSAIYFAERYPHAFIYAVEPDEARFQILLRNTRHYPNIKAIQAAIAQEDGFLPPEQPEVKPSWFAPVEADRRPKARVPTISLQSLLAQYRLSQVDILKMDIAGAEAAVFAAESCHEWLARIRLLAIELHQHRYPACEQSFLEAIARYNCSLVPSAGHMLLDFQDPLLLPGVEPRQRFS